MSGVTQSFIFGAFAKGLAVEGGYIYWTTSLGGNRIMRASLDDPSTHQSVTSTAVAAAGVAVDGVSGHIYWANTGLNTIGGATSTQPVPSAASARRSSPAPPSPRAWR